MMNASFRDATVGSAAVSEGAGGGSFIRRDGALPVPSDPMNHPPHALAAPDPMGTVGAVGTVGSMDATREVVAVERVAWTRH